MSIVIVYHHEEGSWWAESPDVAGFTAFGATFAEVQTLAQEGVRALVGLSRADVQEQLESGAVLDPVPGWFGSAAPQPWTLVESPVHLALSGGGADLGGGVADFEQAAAGAA